MEWALASTMAPAAERGGQACCGDEGRGGPAPPTANPGTPLLTISVISSIFPEELRGQRDPVGAILHGELQEKAGGGTMGQGSPPTLVSLCPSRGQETQAGACRAPPGPRPCPTSEL